MNMKSMSMYSTQYLVEAPFAWITAAMRRGMESISLWHCSGVMRAQVALIVAFSSSALLGLAYRTSWYTAVLTLDFRKHSGPTPADDMAPQTITDCGNFTLDLKQRGFCASPLFLQTLGPWFPKEMQNLLSSENITLDHSAAVQSFLSLAQARRFWRCLLFKSGLTQGMRQLKPMSCIRLCVVVLEALTPAAVHSLWISPTFWMGFVSQSSPGCGYPYCLYTFFYHIFSLPSPLY